MITNYHSSARSRELSTIDEPKTGAWVHAVQPTEKELDFLAESFHLDRDILTDATDIYEVPRVEVSDHSTYVFARYCHPEGQEIATEPILIVYTSGNIITIMRHNGTVLDQIINGRVPILTTQKTKTFLLMLEQINRSYRLQLNLVSKQVLQFRARLRRAEISSVELVKFIEMEEDLNEFLSALQPQSLVVTALESGKYMKLYEDDKDLVEDILLSTNELVELAKSRVRTVVNIRQAYDAIATTNLNRTFKRLTSIAIFLSVATVISGLWGMNVGGLPFHDSRYGFWIVSFIIAIVVFGAIRFFNARKWL
jgi:magnesium transporter